MRSFICLIFCVAAGTLAWGQAAILSEHRVMIPERGEVLGCMISFDTNHFSFLPPPSWRVSCKPGARSIVMISEDLACSITIDFPNLDNSESKHPQDLLAARYANAKLRESFPCHTGVGGGNAFDIERKAPNQARISSRVIYVDLGFTIIEFVLTSPTSKFSEHTFDLDNLVGSFRRPR
jgi:hypothetical protein